MKLTMMFRLIIPIQTHPMRFESLGFSGSLKITNKPAQQTKQASLNDVSKFSLIFQKGLKISV